MDEEEQGGRGTGRARKHGLQGACGDNRPCGLQREEGPTGERWEPAWVRWVGRRGARPRAHSGGLQKAGVEESR